MSKLIGIAGKAGAGKDTVASYVDDLFYKQAEYTSAYSFASPIYSILREWLDLPSSYYNRDLKELVLPLFLTGKRSPKSLNNLYLIVNEKVKGKYTGSNFTHCIEEIYNYLWVKRDAQNLVLNHELFIMVSARELLQLFNKFTEQVDKNFWVGFADTFVKYHKDDTIIVSDVRTPVEVEWLKSMGGKLLYVDRQSEDIPLSGHISESHQKYLKDLADFVIVNNLSKEELFLNVQDVVNGIVEANKIEEGRQLEIEF